MGNEFENTSEEIEILMALRLSGEISTLENQKLEAFFKNNPAIKEQFLKNEKAFALLSKTKQELPTLQLSASKKNALLQLSGTSKSSRNILATYVVAASTFFVFIIGLYLYTNKTFQEPNRTIALGDKNLESTKSKPQVEEEKLVKPSIAPSKEKNETPQPSTVYGSSQELNENEGLAGGQSRAKLKEESDKLPVESEYAESIKEESGRDEKSIVSKNEDAAKKFGAKEKANSADLAKAPATKPAAIEKNKEGSVNDGLLDAAKNQKEEKNQVKKQDVSKFDADEIKSLEKSSVGASNSKKSSAEKPKNFEYIVSIQFNQKEFQKKVISSKSLSNAENTLKMKFQEILEYTNLNIANEIKNESKDRKLILETITILDQEVPAKGGRLAEAKTREDTKVAESASSTIAQEIALISQCILSYQNRNTLGKNDKKQLLESIKKAMNSLIHIQKDEALKQWLEAIEKEFNL